MSLWWPWSSEPVVEDADDGDLADLADLHALCFPHAWSEEEIAGLLGQTGVFCLVVRRSGLNNSRHPLGFVLIRSVAGEAEVLTIAVHPRHRGKGLAGRLMKAATFKLYSDRCECLFLEVDAANEPALRLYKSLGFRKVGERRGYYRAGEGDGTALVMRADLL
ncbi:GNAT family N-acetyltransferase [Roseibium litorale]|uniref:GNAT family N-acetyltransferase n=1 Tax=Roseibium litorale TaxID=2803841 RepID=A0ABR9CNM5_9HYPH|nr:GNAT family N-acetyltransferase [Roseibium litorale]MBD8891882.1 GNAT family N-acetyltransferase [Roseibium litorale]